ncbi:hypothetical protein O4H61_09785 [Roseovarius aestuarii]|nr:hypothetical protein [Roseovarius aestuarii]
MACQFVPYGFQLVAKKDSWIAANDAMKRCPMSSVRALTFSKITKLRFKLFGGVRDHVGLAGCDGHLCDDDGIRNRGQIDHRGQHVFGLIGMGQINRDQNMFRTCSDRFAW